jgi:hypothetical protein
VKKGNISKALCRAPARHIPFWIGRVLNQGWQGRKGGAITDTKPYTALKAVYNCLSNFRKKEKNR